jgi:hypothetical protein
MGKTFRAILIFGRKAIGKQGDLHDTRWVRIALFLLLLGGCVRNPQPDHIKGISCPQEGNGKCPFGCDD